MAIIKEQHRGQGWVDFTYCCENSSDKIQKIYDCKSYPTNEVIKSVSHSSQSIPQYLRTFLKLLVISGVKQNCIGHTIVQASWLRSVIAPIMFGVSTEMDLNPSNETCIYSTLVYIENQPLQLCRYTYIPIPCIMFDQPLWIKAIKIIKSKSLKIVCWLGGFQTIMSFVWWKFRD